MTKKDFQRVLGNVRTYAKRGDDEAAHSAEDELHQMVLQAIADGRCSDPKWYAREALKTQKMSFSRYYA